MTGRIQLFSDPGELGKIGQVWFVESLADDDSTHTARRLREDLQDVLDARARRLRVELRSVANREEFFIVLDELCTSVRATGLNPILDIECHGDAERGLQLADGTLLPWDLVKSKLETINLASRCNMILVLDCCYGAYFGKVSRLHERAAFCAYIAPTGSISVDVLAAGLRAFYAELFTSLDITEAINAMRAAAPEFGYVFFTAYGLFRKVFAESIVDHGIGEGLRLWAEAMTERLRVDRDRILNVVEVAQILKDGEPEAFTQFRRTYFSIDLFPENDARFPLTYEQLDADVKKFAAYASSSMAPAAEG
jgi:hypothetical protein